MTKRKRAPILHGVTRSEPAQMLERVLGHAVAAVSTLGLALGALWLRESRERHHHHLAA